MAKRFASTEIWDDPWFQDLDPKIKLVWKYLCDRCDEAGFWKVNWKQLEFQIGAKIKTEDVIKGINNSKERVKTGSTYWFIIGFAEYQYGSFRTSKHAFHQRLVQKIDTLSNTLSDRVSNTLQEKEEVKEKEEEEEKEQEKEEVKEKEGVLGIIPDELNNTIFINAWSRWFKYRREKRKPLTNSTIEAQLNKLRLMGIDAAVDSINQSIENGWEGLFPRKEQVQRKSFGPQQLTRDLLERQFATIATREVHNGN